MTRPLCLAFVCALLAGCPDFPESALHREGGGESPCVDGDGDGVESCDGDCNDSDKAAYPGQTQYFTSPHSGGFDYNCDGRETPELVDLVQCQDVTGTCTGAGWRDAVPECGASGMFTECQVKAAKCTEHPAGQKAQPCR